MSRNYNIKFPDKDVMDDSNYFLLGEDEQNNQNNQNNQSNPNKLFNNNQKPMQIRLMHNILNGNPNIDTSFELLNSNRKPDTQIKFCNGKNLEHNNSVEEEPKLEEKKDEKNFNKFENMKNNSKDIFEVKKKINFGKIINKDKISNSCMIFNNDNNENLKINEINKNNNKINEYKKPIIKNNNIKDRDILSIQELNNKQNLKKSAIASINNRINIKKNKSPKKKIETQEEKLKREKEEKEKNKIRDNLKCYLCFSKANKTRMCTSCKKIACDGCVRKMLAKNGKCSNCKKESTLDDIILIPFFDDLTSFFIQNFEGKNKQISQIEENPENIQENKEEKEINNEQNEGGDKIILCQIHKDKIVEFFCFQCNEYLCSKCLLFFNKDLIDKHQNHSILSINDIKKYDLEDTLKEYIQLKNTENDIEKLTNDSESKLKEIDVKREKTKQFLIDLAEKLENELNNEYNKLNEVYSNIKTEKEKIDNSLDTIPNSIKNIVDMKDYGQGKQILKELKKMNDIQILKQQIKMNINPLPKLNFQTFESEEIELYLGLDYIEEYLIAEKDLNFIEEHQSDIKVQLLGGNIVFNLNIKIGEEYYNKYKPSFSGYLILLSTKYKGQSSNFFGNYYNKGIQTLTVDFSFDNFKQFINVNSGNYIKIFINKVYYT